MLAWYCAFVLTINMPLDRSPLKNPPPSLGLTMQHSDSEPNLALSSDNTAAFRKRKYCSDLPDEFLSMQDKFTNMFITQKREQDTKLSNILECVSNIKQQNDDIRESIKFMSEKYDNLMLHVQNLQEENKMYKKRIQTLEDKIDGFERLSYTSRIELRNVPKKEGETKEDLVNILLKTGEVIGTTIQQSDVRDIFRINTKNDKNKPIIADFTSILTKERIITHSKKHNRLNKDKKLNSADIAIAGPAVPIFLSENLPQKVRHLYASARIFGKENNYDYCWTTAGRIYLKKTERDKPIVIKSQEDIGRLSTL
ncbi:unnamed protein product [Chilo suppressalis]|uniref:FP protein C-terminal domain-containing protein n=1 Tax=Chilo suppressalis TaxID=168631 RepID=A0ABN8L8Q9_CHISP|nr:unnamed protein product [Chilo suppressalis]